MHHALIIVSGKVQGVFFRASAKEIAGQLNIKGFVQNLPDGSVYIEAEGEEQSLKQFEAWCKQGPPRAHVTKIDIHEGDVKNFERFEIRR